jgi:hypothetical protein
MRWLRYCLLILTPLVLIGVETNAIILFSSADTAAAVGLVGNAFQLLALLYVWRCPPRLREQVVDPIGVFKDEIKLHPPAPKDPGRNVLDAADRLKRFARP